MRPITVNEFQRLLGPRATPCISLFVPTHRHAPGTEQDRIRFKNLLKQVERLLLERFPRSDSASLLAPIEALVDRSFWTYQADGLAVFRSPEVMADYRLPAAVPELAVVSKTFHTRPLVTYLNSNRHFFLLSLSKAGVKLHEGTPYGLVELDVEGLPTPLRDVVRDERGRAYLGIHGDMGAGRSPTRHGHDNGGGNEELHAYFRAVDRALWSFLKDERVPLVLAGVGHYHPIYRAASRYPELLDEAIEGNVERMDLRELHARAMKLLSEYEAQVEHEVVAQFTSALAGGRAGVDLGEVSRAAVHGRVRALAHPQGVHVWGYMDRETGEVQTHDQQRDAEDADVLDDIAEVVLLKGGDVYELPPERMPTRSPVAALYRY